VCQHTANTPPPNGATEPESPGARRTEDLEHLHGKLFAILGACEPDWRFGAILGQEGDRWIMTLGGY